MKGAAAVMVIGVGLFVLGSVLAPSAVGKVPYHVHVRSLVMGTLVADIASDEDRGRIVLALYDPEARTALPPGPHPWSYVVILSFNPDFVQPTELLYAPPSAGSPGTICCITDLGVPVQRDSVPFRSPSFDSIIAGYLPPGRGDLSFLAPSTAPSAVTLAVGGGTAVALIAVIAASYLRRTRRHGP